MAKPEQEHELDFIKEDLSKRCQRIPEEVWGTLVEEDNRIRLLVFQESNLLPEIYPFWPGKEDMGIRYIPGEGEVVSALERDGRVMMTLALYEARSSNPILPYQQLGEANLDEYKEVLEKAHAIQDIRDSRNT